MGDINKNNERFLKCFSAFIVVVIIIALMHVSGTQAQWPYSGIDGPWLYSMPSFGSPFLPFGQIPTYSYNNNPFSPYNSFLTPALPSSSGPWYNAPVNYANSYSHNWFDNTAYSPRSYTSGYSGFQPPPLGTSGYTNWLSSDYNAQYPWRYGSGPPIPISRPEREPIDITSDSGRWESQELTDEEGNRLNGGLKYERSDSFFKMTGSSLPLGEGYLTVFQYILILVGLMLA